jgi:hypothetical protein
MGRYCRSSAAPGGTFWWGNPKTFPAGRIARVSPARCVCRAATRATVRLSAGPDKCVCAGLFPFSSGPTAALSSPARGKWRARTTKPVLAMRRHPSHRHERHELCRLRIKEGGRAPTGATFHWPCSAEHGSAPHQRMLPSARASGALASRRPTAALAEAVTPRLSSGPRFLKSPGANGRTLPGVSAASSSRTGRSAGRAGPRSRPGAECVVPPAGTALAYAIRSTLMMASLESSERDNGGVTEMGTNVKDNVVTIATTLQSEGRKLTVYVQSIL